MKLKPIPDVPLNGVVSDELAAAMAKRNSELLEQAKQRLGDRYLLARPIARPKTPQRGVLA